MKGPKKKWQYYILILILGPLYPPSPAPIPCAGSSRYPPFLSKGGGRVPAPPNPPRILSSYLSPLASLKTFEINLEKANLFIFYNYKPRELYNLNTSLNYNYT